MDTIRGIPALDDGDAASLIGQATRDLRMFLLSSLPIAGSVVVTADGTGIGTAVVAFPAGWFASAPVVTVTAISGSPAVENVQITDKTASGFTVVLRRTNTTATSVDWIALPEWT